MRHRRRWPRRRGRCRQPAPRTALRLQDFGKPGNLAAELGIPFCAMDGAARYRTGEHTESLGGSKKLVAVEGNVRELRLLV